MENWIVVIIFIVPLVLLAIAALADVYRRPDLSWAKRIAWTIAVLVLPYLGVLVYFASRPPNPPAGKRYDDEEARATAVVDTLERLRGEHEAGDIDDAEYLTAKREALGLTSQPND